jgi:hypothetical protein
MFVPLDDIQECLCEPKKWEIVKGCTDINIVAELQGRIGFESIIQEMMHLRRGQAAEVIDGRVILQSPK